MLRPKSFDVPLIVFIPVYNPLKGPDKKIARQRITNRQTKEEEGEKSAALFTPIKLLELICNRRLYGSALSLSASRVPSRDVENEQDKSI